MSTERETGSTSSPTADPSSTQQRGPIEYHQAPSAWWFIIPFALLIAYGYFSR